MFCVDEKTIEIVTSLLSEWPEISIEANKKKIIKERSVLFRSLELESQIVFCLVRIENVHLISRYQDVWCLCVGLYVSHLNLNNYEETIESLSKI